MTSVNQDSNPYRQNERSHRRQQEAENQQFKTHLREACKAYEASCEGSPLQQKLYDRAHSIYTSIQNSTATNGVVPEELQKFGLTSPEVYDYLKSLKYSDQAISVIKTFIDPSRVELTSCIVGSSYGEAANRKQQRLLESESLAPENSGPASPISEHQGLNPSSQARLTKTMQSDLLRAQTEQRMALHNYLSCPKDQSDYASVMLRNGRIKQVYEAERRFASESEPSVIAAAQFQELNRRHNETTSNLHKNFGENKAQISQDYLAQETLAKFKDNPASVSFASVKLAKSQLGIDENLTFPTASTYIPSVPEFKSFMSDLNKGEVPWSQLPGLKVHLARLYKSKNPEDKSSLDPAHIEGPAKAGLKIAVTLLLSQGAKSAANDLISHAKSQGINYTPSPKTEVEGRFDERSSRLTKITADWEGSLKRFYARETSSGLSSEELAQTAALKLSNYSLEELTAIRSNTRDSNLAKVLDLALLDGISQRLTNFKNSQGESYQEEVAIKFFLQSKASENIASLLKTSNKNSDVGKFLENVGHKLSLNIS